MFSYNPVYVLPEWGQWRIEYDGKLCDEAETYEEAIRLGRIWARKLRRFLAIQSEEGTVTTAHAGYILTVIGEDDALPMGVHQRCEDQRQKARRLREGCEIQLQHAALLREQMQTQRMRLEEVRAALQQEIAVVC